MAITPVHNVSPDIASGAELLAEASGGKATDPKLVKAAHDFEAYVMGYVFQTAYESIPQSEFSGGGMADSVFQSMFIQEVTAQHAKEENGRGLADMMLRQWGRKGTMAVDRVQEDIKNIENSESYESFTDRI